MFYKFFEGIFALLVCLLMFTGCGVSVEQVEESGAKTENEWMDNLLLKTKIEEYLAEEVSELNEYKAYISEESNYEAAMLYNGTGELVEMTDWNGVTTTRSDPGNARLTHLFHLGSY